MPRVYSSGRVGYSLREVAALTYLHRDDVLLLVGCAELDYLQDKPNQPQYIPEDSLNRYLRLHVDEIVERKKELGKKRC